MGKTVCEKTSLLPRSCLVSRHLAAVGVSLLTCGAPATGKGSVTGQWRSQIKDATSIRERPTEVEDRAIPGH